MPRGDAVQDRPTVADEMAKFQGFAVKDGETIDPKTEDLNPVKGKNTTEGEDRAAADTTARAAAKGKETPLAATAAPKSVKLTDEETNAALDAAEATKGADLTPEESAAALRAAQTKKDTDAGIKPPRPQKDRLNRAYAAASRANARAAAAEATNKALEARIAALETGATKNPLTAVKESATKDGAPDPKDFEFGELDVKYLRALARYETQQEIAADRKTKETAAAAAKTKAEQEEMNRAAAAFEDAGSEKYDDFQEVVIQAAHDKAWPLSDVLGEVLLVSEYGPDIAYELASDLTLAKKVFGLPPLKQVAWMGQQEARLVAGASTTGKTEESEAAAAAKAETAAKSASKAPAPVQRARGTNSNSAVPGDTSNFAAFEAAAMGRTRK